MPVNLRPYQLEIANAVLDSVLYRKGLTFSVEIARQGGKNELSAHLERLLLTLNVHWPLQIVKCSPTFKPQTIISMMRLKDCLNDSGLNGAWTSEMGYIVRLGDARAVFLSADASSNVVGNTAHLLLEVDESQDVDPDKYTKEFKPMTASTNCTVIHYGTTWDDSTLLESIKQTNLELEKKDGVRRHFRYDYQEVGKYNRDYLLNAEMERLRLGEDHPLFLTQYRLLPLHGGGGFLNSVQQTQLQGTHSRLHHPPDSSLTTHNSKLYVAAIDLAGEAESGEDDFQKSLRPRQDSTVITIGEIEIRSQNREAIHQNSPTSILTPDFNLLFIKIVGHYSWTGCRHVDLYPRIIDILKNVWHCRSIVVDATGIGQPVASFLRQSLGSRVKPFTFTARAKSDLGFNLLAAVNSGRLKMYAADGSPEYQEFWRQIERAPSFYRPNRTLNFFVNPSDGHDDFLMSLALLVESAGLYEPRTARGSS